MYNLLISNLKGCKMDNLKRIGHALRVARTEKSYSQEALGDILGVKFQTVGNWERGAAIPRKWWAAIMEATGLDIGELMTRNKKITADNQSNAAGKSIFNMNQGVSLSASEQALIDGLRKLGDKEDETIFEFLGMISKMLKNQ
jgi:DNA-binding XRE family transcriptional regulator